MTWAVYMRVSMKKQDTENQKLGLEQFVNQRGIKAQWFNEIESTRKTRPIKQKLLMALRSGEYEGLLIWRLDRWARSTLELIMEIEELSKKNIQFVSIKDLGEINYETAIGKLMVHIIGSFANFERDLIRERTMEGLSRAKAQGKKLGRPKGSKDKKRRKKSGYHQRWANNGGA